MRKLCLTISRFTISAWVGAACLFVLTTLREVHSPKLDSVTKAELVTLRFPVYYSFAFGLIAVTLILITLRSLPGANAKPWTSILLLALILALTTIDYIWVYQPLEQMTAAVQQARPATFVSLHRASKWINTIQIGLSLVTALVVCRPIPESAIDSP